MKKIKSYLSDEFHSIMNLRKYRHKPAGKGYNKSQLQSSFEFRNIMSQRLKYTALRQKSDLSKEIKNIMQQRVLANKSNTIQDKFKTKVKTQNSADFIYIMNERLKTSESSPEFS